MKHTVWVFLVAQHSPRPEPLFGRGVRNFCTSATMCVEGGGVYNIMMLHDRAAGERSSTTIDQSAVER